jgi:4-hydroxy-tetrahydrodipicolinate synthase
MPDMLKMLAAVSHFVGWKMTYPYPAYRVIALALRVYKRHVAVLVAGTSFLHESLAADLSDGTVSGFWNYAREPIFSQDWV